MSKSVSKLVDGSCLELVYSVVCSKCCVYLVHNGQRMNLVAKNPIKDIAEKTNPIYLILTSRLAISHYKETIGQATTIIVLSQP